MTFQNIFLFSQEPKAFYADVSDEMLSLIFSEKNVLECRLQLLCLANYGKCPLIFA